MSGQWRGLQPDAAALKAFNRILARESNSLADASSCPSPPLPALTGTGAIGTGKLPYTVLPIWAFQGQQMHVGWVCKELKDKPLITDPPHPSPL